MYCSGNCSKRHFEYFQKVFMCLWTDFVSATGSQLCKIQSRNFTGVQFRSKCLYIQTLVIKKGILRKLKGRLMVGITKLQTTKHFIHVYNVHVFDFFNYNFLLFFSFVIYNYLLLIHLLLLLLLLLPPPGVFFFASVCLLTAQHQHPLTDHHQTWSKHWP